MATVTNPRFPHKCKVYRCVGVSSFKPDGDIAILYEGECRKSSSTNIRTFNTGTASTGKVDTTDFRVSMPGIISGIDRGDLIDVTDLIGTITKMRIVNVSASLMANATEVLCNISSN